ncbi:MAG: FeoA family protein [Planctomycetota bacterium]
MADADKKPAGREDRNRGAPPMPVTTAPVGSQVELAEIRGGRGLVFRLAEMGLTPGVRFTVVSRSRPGPLIINLRGTRLMLGAGMAGRVYVRPV